MTNEQLVELIQMKIDTNKNIEKLYKQNLPLIRAVCKPYTSMEPMEDLLNTAFFGLMEAVDRYDSTKGYKFMTYCTGWIKQSIQQYLDNSRLVRIPRNMNNLLLKYKRFISYYELEHSGLLPPDKEITQELQISKEQLADLKKYMLFDRIESLDSPLDEEWDNTMLDYIASPDSLEEDVIGSVFKQEMKEAVHVAMETALTEQEQETVKEYFFRGSTLDQIAKQKGITREAVRQQLAHSKRKLQRGKSGKILQRYSNIDNTRYHGSLAFFKSHGSTVEYEISRKDEILENSISKYLQMKRQEQERHEKRLAESRII